MVVSLVEQKSETQHFAICVRYGFIFRVLDKLTENVSNEKEKLNTRSQVAQANKNSTFVI